MSFFFSSRRRHTRSYGDWSSDVCSSDLIYRALLSSATGKLQYCPALFGHDPDESMRCFGEFAASHQPMRTVWFRQTRSEERRVGKEWIDRRAGDARRKEGDEQYECGDGG